MQEKWTFDLKTLCRVLDEAGACSSIWGWVLPAHTLASFLSLWPTSSWLLVSCLRIQFSHLHILVWCGWLCLQISWRPMEYKNKGFGAFLTKSIWISAISDLWINFILIKWKIRVKRTLWKFCVGVFCRCYSLKGIPPQRSFTLAR